MAICKQGAVYTRVFSMVASSDHVTPKTGLTVTVVISKAGAAFAAAAGAVSEIANGFYKIAVTSVDTNTIGDLAFYCTGAAADPTSFVDQIQTNMLDDLSITSGSVSITSNIKKNTPLAGFVFAMTNSTTHAAQPGLVVSAQRSLGGAGFTPCTNSVSELSNGCYSINLSAADLNANTVMLRFTAPAADDLDILILTAP